MLKKLKTLNLSRTQVSDAGCAALAAALDSGALPALEVLKLVDIPASAAAKAAVYEARDTLEHTELGSESASASEGEGEEESEEEDEEEGVEDGESN